MKKIITAVFFTTGLWFISSAQIYIADSCRVVFFSEAPIENITAVNLISKPIMSIATGEIDIKINNQFFKFKKELMQEHFNEEYMETGKYPYSTFTGKVNEKLDYTKNGENKVTVSGTMDMHGVKNKITIPGTITIQNGKLFLKAVFYIKPADYKIKVPSLMGSNIAEQLEVTLTSTMSPYGGK